MLAYTREISKAIRSGNYRKVYLLHLSAEHEASSLSPSLTRWLAHSLFEEKRNK